MTTCPSGDVAKSYVESTLKAYPAGSLSPGCTQSCAPSIQGPIGLAATTKSAQVRQVCIDPR